MISLLTTFCVFLFSSLLSATENYRKDSKTKHPIHNDTTDGYLCLSYNSLMTSVDILSRTCSSKLLTKNAMLAAMQQNIHAILKLFFGDYHLSDNYSKGIEAHRDQQLKARGKSDSDEIEIFIEKFIEYDVNLECLFVAKIAQGNRKCVKNLKYYQINAQLPSTGVLYSKMITKGIDLNFVLHLFPRMISSYEISFKTQAPDDSDLTKALNDLIKEFIWTYCQTNNEKIEQPSLSIMKHLAKKFFKEILNARLRTLKQRQNGCLYIHIISKPYTVYGCRTFPCIGYTENRIKLIEKCKLPICPSTTDIRSPNNLHYCIHTYNSYKDSKLKVKDPKLVEQKANMSLLKAAIPLMRVPENTILITYLVFSKKYLIDLLKEKRQRHDVKELRDKDQCTKDIPSFSLMISDERFGAFMNHFVNYLYTNENQDLFEMENIYSVGDAKFEFNKIP